MARWLGATLLLSLSLFAEADSWRIDPLHSAAHFSVRHMMISRVRGDFTGVTGTVLYDAKNPAQASVEATIDCSTLNTGVAKRDAQMRGPDFFEILFVKTGFHGGLFRGFRRGGGNHSPPGGARIKC